VYVFGVDSNYKQVTDDIPLTING
ncbi:hypothetical protein UA3_00329, partial [Enterococcus faecium EnGen0263]